MWPRVCMGQDVFGGEFGVLVRRMFGSLDERQLAAIGVDDEAVVAGQNA